VLSSLIRIVLGRASRGAAYLCPNLLELMDGSTSSRVATNYHWLTNLYTDLWFLRWQYFSIFRITDDLVQDGFSTNLHTKLIFRHMIAFW